MKPIAGIPFDKIPYEPIEFVGILLFAVYPSTIIYKDAENNIIIKEWVDCSPDNKVDRFFYYSVGRNWLKKFINGSISHLDLINYSNEDYVYFQDEEDEKRLNTFLVSIQSIPTNYLPTKDFKFNSLDGVDIDVIDANFDLNHHKEQAEIIPFKIKQVSKKENSETIYIHLEKGNGVGYGTIRTGVLAATLGTVDELYKNMALDYSIGKERGEVRLGAAGNKSLAAVVETEWYGITEAASFGFMIRPVTSFIDNFNADRSPSAIIAESVVNLINNSQNKDKLKEEYQSHSRFTMTSYENFLKEVYENQLKIDVNWYNPKSSKEIHSNIDFVSANHVTESIKAMSFSDNKKIKIIGKFRAINMETSHFVFVSTKQERFTGKFDKTTKEGLDKANFVDVYKITISRVTEKKPGKEDKFIDEIESFINQNEKKGQNSDG